MRALVLAGHDVHVVATEAALRFVGRPTLEAISRNPVHTELYEGVAEVRHVAIGQARRPDRRRAGDREHDREARRRPRRRPARQHRSSPRRRRSWSPRRCTPRCGRTRRPSPTSRPCCERGVHVVGPASGQLTGTDCGPGPHGGARRHRRGGARRGRGRATSRAGASWSPPAARANRSTRCASSATARAASRASRSRGPPPRAAPR